MVASLLGGLFGAFVQVLILPEHLPIMGAVIGGLFFFVINEAVRSE